jgi:hypothetical protein
MAELTFEDLKLLKPEALAAALVKLAGKNPRVDALILQINAIAENPKRAEVYAPKSAKKQARLVARAKEVKGHMEKSVAGMVAGFTIEGEYVGFLPMLAAALLPALPKIVQGGVKMIGDALGGGKKAAVAKQKIQTIQQGANAGDEGMAKALSVLKQADAVRSAVQAPGYGGQTQGDPAALVAAKELTGFFAKMMGSGYSLTPPAAVHTPAPEPMPVNVLPAYPQSPYGGMAPIGYPPPYTPAPTQAPLPAIFRAPSGAYARGL